MRIKLMRDNAKMPKAINGNWKDTYVSKIGTVSPDKEGNMDFENDVIWFDENKHDKIYFSKDDVVIVKLGFALELPKGKELHLLPRSSTFKHTGLLLTNSMGIGDDTFIADEDEYQAMFYATRDGVVEIGQRLIQIRVEESMSEDESEFELVSTFNNHNTRGGYGTSGR